MALRARALNDDRSKVRGPDLEGGSSSANPADLCTACRFVFDLTIFLVAATPWHRSSRTDSFVGAVLPAVPHSNRQKMRRNGDVFLGGRDPLGPGFANRTDWLPGSEVDLTVVHLKLSILGRIER